MTSDLGVDVAALSTWMDEQGLGSGRIGDVEPINGGTQNVLVRFSRGGRQFVLRRGPLHLRSTSNDALCKEMLLLDALGATDVCLPSAGNARLVDGCHDAEREQSGAQHRLPPHLRTAIGAHRPPNILSSVHTPIATSR